MSTINKWEALSLRDRAFLIREAVRNGITDINSIRDLYNQSHQFSGEEDNTEKTDKNTRTIEWRLSGSPSANYDNRNTYWSEIFAPIYAKAHGKSVAFVKNDIENILENTPIRLPYTKDEISIGTSAHYDPSTKEIVVNPSYMNESPTIVHEQTHAVDDEFLTRGQGNKYAKNLTLTEDEKKLLREAYPGHAVKAHYNNPQNQNYHVTSEGRSVNNELRYILYDSYRHAKTRDNNIGTFEEWVNKLPNYKLLQYSRQAGYYNSDDWEEPYMSEFQFLNSSVLTDYSHKLPKGIAKNPNDVRKWALKTIFNKPDESLLLPHERNELEEILHNAYINNKFKHEVLVIPSIYDKRKKAVLEVASNVPENNDSTRLRAEYGGNLKHKFSGAEYNPSEDPGIWDTIKGWFSKEDPKYITKDNYIQELANFRNAFEEFKPEAYWDSFGKKYTVGTGLTYYLDENGNETKVKKGDRISKEDNDIQIARRVARDEEYARGKTPFWDKYHPELKFQILEAMYNVGPKAVWVSSKNYQNALREYEKEKGWKKKDYDLKNIFQHADWNLNNQKWLGVRSAMRRNPQAINPEDYKMIYKVGSNLRDSLRTAYHNKFNNSEK